MEIRYTTKTSEFRPLGQTVIIPTEYGKPYSYAFERNNANETAFAVYNHGSQGDDPQPAEEPFMRLFVRSNMDWSNYFDWLNSQIEELCINDVRIYPEPTENEV